MHSKQSFAAYGSDGKLLAGGRGKVHTVKDVWVFERALNSDVVGVRWRLAGRWRNGKFY